MPFLVVFVITGGEQSNERSIHEPLKDYTVRYAPMLCELSLAGDPQWLKRHLSSESMLCSVSIKSSFVAVQK
jgi:hypothetical protein